jgi:hypothetical protein
MHNLCVEIVNEVPPAPFDLGLRPTSYQATTRANSGTPTILPIAEGRFALRLGVAAP